MYSWHLPSPRLYDRASQLCVSSTDRRRAEAGTPPYIYTDLLALVVVCRVPRDKTSDKFDRPRCVWRSTSAPRKASGGGHSVVGHRGDSVQLFCATWHRPCPDSVLLRLLSSPLLFLLLPALPSSALRRHILLVFWSLDRHSLRGRSSSVTVQSCFFLPYRVPNLPAKHLFYHCHSKIHLSCQDWKTALSPSAKLSELQAIG